MTSKRLTTTISGIPGFVPVALTLSSFWGGLFVADQESCRLYFHNLTGGSPSTAVVAGGGGCQRQQGFNGDGGLASGASFSNTLGGLAALPGSSGLVYVCDGGARGPGSAGASGPLLHLPPVAPSTQGTKRSAY